jgi:hypothetical protein
MSIVTCLAFATEHSLFLPSFVAYQVFPDFARNVNKMRPRRHELRDATRARWKQLSSLLADAAALRKQGYATDEAAELVFSGMASFFADVDDYKAWQRHNAVANDDDDNDDGAGVRNGGEDFGLDAPVRRMRTAVSRRRGGSGSGVVAGNAGSGGGDFDLAEAGDVVNFDTSPAHTGVGVGALTMPAGLRNLSTTRTSNTRAQSKAQSKVRVAILFVRLLHHSRL